jgi:hypothetical protein
MPRLLPWLLCLARLPGRVVSFACVLVAISCVRVSLTQLARGWVEGGVRGEGLADPSRRSVFISIPCYAQSGATATALHPDTLPGSTNSSSPRCLPLLLFALFTFMIRDGGWMRRGVLLVGRRG